MASKRYVLLESDRDASDAADELVKFVKERYGDSKAIEVKGSPRMLILKTTNVVAEPLKELRGGFRVGGRSFRPLLTSGAVGNLKRRATEAKSNGEVHER
jgi:hypothetical protein